MSALGFIATVVGWVILLFVPLYVSMAAYGLAVGKQGSPLAGLLPVSLRTGIPLYWGAAILSEIWWIQDLWRSVAVWIIAAGVLSYTWGRGPLILQQVVFRRPAAPLDRFRLQWLLKALQDGAVPQRCWAAATLGDARETRAVEPLISALWSREDPVTAAVVVALGNIGDGHAVEPISHALRIGDEKEYWPEAVRALGKIGGPPAAAALQAAFLDALRERLKHGTAKLESRSELIMATLLQIRERGPLDILVAALTDKDRRLRRAVAEALTALGWHPTDDAQRARFAIAHQQWDEAVAAGDAAVPGLASLLTDVSGDPPLRREVVRALGKIGGPAAAAALQSALLTTDWETTRASGEALEALGWRPANAEECVVRAVVREEWDEAAKFGSVAIRHLDHALLWTTDDRKKEAVIRALGQISCLRAAEILMDYRHTPEGAAALVSVGLPALEPLLALLEKQNVTYAHDRAKNIWFLLSSGIRCDADEIGVTLRIIAGIGGAPAIGRLAEVAKKNSGAAWPLINAIQRALEGNASDVTQEDLHAVAALDGVSQWCADEEADRQEPELMHVKRDPVDCSEIRLLAKRELRRRGL